MNLNPPISLRRPGAERFLLGIAAITGALTAWGHGGEVVLEPETSLTATFSLSSVGGSLASAAITDYISGNIEVNFPPGFVRFNFGSGARMEDVSFQDPGLGSFELKGWRIGLSTISEDPGEPLSSSGSFDMGGHVVAIDGGVLTGNLNGLGPITRDFSVTPLLLTQNVPLQGFISGDTSGGLASVSFRIPWDHQGSLWSSDGVSLDVSVRGLVAGGGQFSPIPEPSSFWPVALALSGVGFWRLRAKGAGGESTR